MNNNLNSAVDTNNLSSSSQSTTGDLSQDSVASSSLRHDSSKEDVIPHKPVVRSVCIDQVVALYDFKATTEDTISFPKNAIINIYDKSTDWWVGEYDGKRGLLPFNYVQPIDANKMSLPKQKEDDTNSIATEGRDTDSYRETDSLDAYEATVEEMQEPEAEPQHIPVPKNPTKMDKMRFNVIRELLQTEDSYVQNLKRVIEIYYAPLKQRKILNDQQLQIVFSNWPQIIEVNNQFYIDLFSRYSESRKAKQLHPHIGDILLKHLPNMKIYSAFVSSRRASDNFILERNKTSNDFNEIINKALSNGEFILKKLLILPMQRITQYSLLIEKLIKYVPNTDDDYDKLNKALQISINLIKKINDEVGRKDDLVRLEWLDEHLASARAMGLRFTSKTNFMGERQLLYYGGLVKESGKELFGFLFNDLVLLIEASQSQWDDILKNRIRPFGIYRSPIILDTIRSVQVRQSQSSSGDVFFQINTEKELNLLTSNPVLKNEWIKQLQKAISEYKDKKQAIAQSFSQLPVIQKNPVGKLVIIIQEAQDILADFTNDDKIMRNSLCEVRMGSQKYMTHTVENSLNPKWNTSMQFLIFDFQKEILNITVYDRKIFSPNFFLGRINLSMAQLRKENSGDGVSIIKAFNLSDVKTGKIIIKLNLMLN